MADSEENRVSVKIYERTLDALKDAQYEARKARKPEPTYAELLDAAWQCYSATEANQEHPEPFLGVDDQLTVGLPDSDKLLFVALAALLRDENPDVAHARQLATLVLQPYYQQHVAGKKAVSKRKKAG